MFHSQFINELRSIETAELRLGSEEWFECVLSRNKLSEVTILLSAYFKTPIKRSGEKPSAEAKRMTAAYGGIRKSQTLYYLKQNDREYCAMLWPWEDGEHITLKVIQIDPHQPVPSSRNWFQKILSWFQ